MAQPKNRQEFVELEYCFDKYFDEYFAPIVDEEYKTLKAKQLEEYSGTLRDHPGTPGVYGSYMGNAITAYEEVKTVGEWGPKDADYLMEQCFNRFFSNDHIGDDIEKMKIAWFSAIVGEIGVDKYKELSSGVPTGDLTSYYVTNRFQTLFLERLAKLEMPKSTLEYITTKGFEESLPGKLINLPIKASDHEKEVKRLAEKFYNPSLVEDASAFGLSFILDSACIGGYSSAGEAATWAGIDGVIHIAGNHLPSGRSFDELFGEVVWGDKKAVTSMREDVKNVRPYNSQFFDPLESSLSNKLLFRSSPHVFDGVFKNIDIPRMEQNPDYISQLRQDGEMYFAARRKFGNNGQGGLDEEPKDGQTEGQKAQQGQFVSGWDSLLDGVGLSGFGDVGKNLGYVLAMLPDLLIGMFTGQTKRLNISDNLMPIAAIFGGMFVKNPLLKMLLVGLGGANLLNKAGHEALEARDGKSAVTRQYRTYDDEQLDRRIKNPAMQGNTLLADVDGVPLVIPVSDEAVDAYYKGALPLNTLSNAVLRALDRQQEVVALQYEESMDISEETVRSRGIQ